jgi:NAD(P)-dependent dehydrogenase (short-subunit alcohol dehydrogenase family)
MGGILEARAKLGGKVAAIVGGGGGIGRGVTLALAEAGVDLAICDIDETALAATARDAEQSGRDILALRADATDPQALDRFYEAIGTQFDRLDIVVNVVGGVRRGAFMDATPDSIDADIRRNYGYVIQSVRQAVPLIRRGGRGGSIVNFTTIEAHRGAAGFAVYAGAKAATANLTRALAVEFGAEGIRLNCIAPDTTPSRGNAAAIAPEIGAAMAALPPEGQGAGFAMYIPAKRPPSVDALANAVLFLASDLAEFVTGTTLHVDGGTMAAAGFLDWPFGDGHLPVPLAGTLGRLYGST